jgi:hypothetical protein
MIRLLVVIFFLIPFTGFSQEVYDLSILESVLPKTLNGCKLANEKQSKFLETKEMSLATVYGLYRSKKLIIEVNLFDYTKSKQAYIEATSIINDIKPSERIELLEINEMNGFIENNKIEKVQYVKLKWKDRYFLVLEISGYKDKKEIISIIKELELSILH